MKYAKIGERKRGKAELTARRLGGCERCGWTVGVRATHKWNRLEYFLVLREALGRRPREPGITEASSEMMSPNKLLVTITPLRARGFFTINMAAESMRWWPSFN